ncbi:hypothetical protein [Kibdelosporangium phytohabitans]|nr:hypothetical protein [Kibdelosporangium phytohabitans]MBE1465204.1 hypothetical protein [Kibdelosporangium phytohabitans]
MTLYCTLSEAIKNGRTDQVSEWATGVLDEVASGRGETAAIRHPLGFLCLPVHRQGDEGVCVHLWGPLWHTSLTTLPTHCHSWELLSCVLTGELHNQVISVIDDNAAPTHRVFEVHSSADGDEIRPTARRVRHETASVDVYRSGDCYELPAGVFHQTVVPDLTELVVTVALGLTNPNAVDLSLADLDMSTHRVRRRKCDRGETIAAASIAHQAIAAGVPLTGHQ